MTTTTDPAAACRAAREAWAARWPNHCRNCEGAGAVTVLVGSGDECEAEGEDCEDCQTGEGRCPRCAHPGAGVYADPCPACGWTYGGPDAVMPSAEPIWRAESAAEWERRKAEGTFVDPFGGPVE